MTTCSDDHSRLLPDIGRRKPRSSNGYIHLSRIVNPSSPGAPCAARPAEHVTAAHPLPWPSRGIDP